MLRFFLDERAQSQGITFSQPREGDAGFDIQSLEKIEIPPGAQVVLSTGLHVAIPTGWVGLVRERSSTGMKRLYTHSGVIDSNYRGEVRILISNNASMSYQVEVGDKVAQLLIIPCLTGGERVSSLEALGDTQRGSAGFGSSGR